jgi:hypothetical protein
VVCLLGRRRQEDVNVKQQCLSVAERVRAVCVCSERRGWEESMMMVECLGWWRVAVEVS